MRATIGLARRHEDARGAYSEQVVIDRQDALTQLIVDGFAWKDGEAIIEERHEGIVTADVGHLGVHADFEQLVADGMLGEPRARGHARGTALT